MYAFSRVCCDCSRDQPCCDRATLEEVSISRSFDDAHLPCQSLAERQPYLSSIGGKGQHEMLSCERGKALLRSSRSARGLAVETFTFATLAR